MLLISLRTQQPLARRSAYDAKPALIHTSDHMRCIVCNLKQTLRSLSNLIKCSNVRASLCALSSVAFDMRSRSIH